MKADRVLIDTDGGLRRAYELRAARSEPGLEPAAGAPAHHAGRGRVRPPRGAPLASRVQHTWGPSARLAPVHTLALQLAPVLAAEKSKVPFFIAGGLLVVWALTLSLGSACANRTSPAAWPASARWWRSTAVLVLAAVSTAVLTSSVPAKGTVPPNKTQALAPVPSVSAPVEPSTSAAASEPAAPAPVATTGTPAPASSPSPGKATTRLALAANPTGLLAYNTKQLSAKAGT